MSILTSAVLGQPELSGGTKAAMSSRSCERFESGLESSWDRKPNTCSVIGAMGGRRQVVDLAGGHLLSD